MCLLVVSGFLNYSNNYAYSKSATKDNGKSDDDDSDKKTAAATTTSYKDAVLSYDKEKNCTNDLSKRPNATEYLTYFNCGHVSIDTKHKITNRQFTIIAQENNIIPISDVGHKFIAWTYNGTVPGPTMRMTEGDHVNITLINPSTNKHAHSIHMHSIHPGSMDGIGGPGGMVAPGQRFTYSFIAQPYGLYPYHCHVDPVVTHENRGLYGMMIIDPVKHREKMKEFAMLMNGYDMNYTHENKQYGLPPLDKANPTHLLDGGDAPHDNQIYTVNGVAFVYKDHPIKLQAGEKYRIYLVNMLQFDHVNSFHVHGMMFNYIPGGTTDKPSYKNDIVTLSEANRGIIEFKTNYPGQYMFHAHNAEFTDKGWMGFFDVVPKEKEKAL